MFSSIPGNRDQIPQGLAARTHIFWMLPKNKLIVLLVLWLLATGLGFHILLSYKGMPGKRGQTPSSWVQNDLVSLSDKPLVVVFAHPLCPCTKATLGQLEQLITDASDQFEAVVLFYEPAAASKDWSSSPLVRAARSIPTVRVVLDEDGKLAGKFCVTTSGHTLVYSPDGLLRFSGGITGARGHLGYNAGYAAVRRLLISDSASPALTTTTTPTFGCELFNPCDRNQIARK